MTNSKGWDWKKVTEHDHTNFWRTPSIESFYLVNRWQNLGFKDFLDLGCGLGRHAILFGQNGFNVSCLDISPDAISQTKKWADEENLHFDYQVGDMLDLPYPTNSFDSILCYHVITHTDTTGIQKIIQEIHRVLRSGGECYLNLGSKNHWMWKETNWPLVDDNTKLRQEPGPEYNVPHFYADYNLIQELFKNFDILDIRQIETFRQNKVDQKIHEHWHYDLLLHKP